MVFIAFPTFVFWRRGRRRKPGHCGCGYDLTGNVSGRCPECGETTDRSLPPEGDGGGFDGKKRLHGHS